MKNNCIPKPYKILEITKQSNIEYLFRLEYDEVDKINYGQFLQVSVPMVGEAPISITDFSINEGWIELLIRKVGKVTDSIFQLNIGDTLCLRGSYGNGFNFDNYKGKNLVIIAGGSGLAPVRSVINYVYNNLSEVNGIEVLVGFKNEDAILFRNDLEKWSKKFNTIVTLDVGQETDHNYIGRVTDHLDKLKLLQENKDAVEVLVVGPPLMMKFTAIELEELGIRSKNMWLSFERNMSCALGKCGHCKINETYVCLEGPIFRYDKAKTLVD